jgi:hypothetical protein
LEIRRIRKPFSFYRGTELPVLLALEERNQEAAAELLRELLPTLPPRFFCHFSPYLQSELAAGAHVEPHGTFLKMKLTRREALESNTAMSSDTIRLSHGRSSQNPNALF